MEGEGVVPVTDAMTSVEGILGCRVGAPCVGVKYDHFPAPRVLLIPLPFIHSGTALPN